MSEHPDCVQNKDLCILSTSEIQLSNFISLHCLQISCYISFVCCSLLYFAEIMRNRKVKVPLLIIENNSKKYLLILVGGFLRHNYVKCPSLVATSPLYFWWVVGRYRPIFFDQVGHQTTYASIWNRNLFTISCNCQTY